MDAPMTPREAVAWLLENTAATRKTYCIILRSTNGVHNPGTRGMLICQAAELAGRLHAYRESLHHIRRPPMTAEERAALIDRLTPLIVEERRKAAEQNTKRPPWYMVNIAHPVMGWLYNQYLAKLGEVSPPGDVCRTRFELSILHPAALKQLAEHYKIQ